MLKPNEQEVGQSGTMRYNVSTHSHFHALTAQSVGRPWGLEARDQGPDSGQGKKTKPPKAETKPSNLLTF